ncbi:MULTISPECIES: hypothetical protein [Terrabacteria group]|uniref:hypothetical protein n=1 Tax=Bacillati TaxID=1783272 RepID=UPI001C6EE107|nr:MULTISPECIES: hypothetical protein [Terrabacteria group]MBW9211819.1 hypothetical protein [Trueperella sp. zg.1013]
MKKSYIFIIVIVALAAILMALFYFKEKNKPEQKKAESQEVQKPAVPKPDYEDSSKPKEEENKDKPNQEVQDKKENRIQVHGLKEIDKDTVLADGSDAKLPSTARVFVLEVKAKEVKEAKLKIVSATLTTVDKEKYMAEGADVNTKTIANIVGQDLSKAHKGFLFFITLDPGRTLKKGKGQLSLTLSNQEVLTLNVEF